ncbi:MAG: aminotransferase class IV [Senegalia sp. (in: firmicutes)]|uniref:aminotransferase class IV n=1 Tax=Senegalia sp. (in: firmicutes) TaxID=1924098 RepID=UPI003F9A8D51
MNINTFSEFFVYNNEICSDKDLKLSSGEKVYEVIRVIDGAPLFLEEHIQRLEKSIELLGYKSQITDEEINKNIYKLIEKNKVENMNIKIIFNYYKDGFESVFYFIKSSYPKEYVYDQGVKVITLKAERDNPNIKKVNNDFKNMVKYKLEEKNAFEALLIDEDEYITEGSRSNMFFVKGREIYTAPKGDVLLGVTRANILKACEDLNVIVIEKNLKKEELKEIDGLFMSGTSIGVLPIGIVDEEEYNSAKNTIIKDIRREYEKRVLEDINNNKG